MVVAMSGDARVFGPGGGKAAFYVAVLFAVAAFFYVVPPRAEHPSVLFWSFCSVNCILSLFLVMSVVCGYPRLTLNEQGLEYATLFGTVRYRWSDLQEFAVVVRSRSWPMIGLKFSPSYRGWRGTRVVPKNTARFEAYIPGLFSVSLEEICAEMRAFQSLARK